MPILDSNANKKLQSLLEMSKDGFEGISARWTELCFSSSIQNLSDFKIGYIFGIIENNFISWFYSEMGRSLTDDEYKEFWEILTDHVKKF